MTLVPRGKITRPQKLGRNSWGLRGSQKLLLWPRNGTKVLGSKRALRARMCTHTADRAFGRKITWKLILGSSYRASTISWSYTISGATNLHSLNTSNLTDVHLFTGPRNESDLLGVSKQTSSWNLIEPPGSVHFLKLASDTVALKRLLPIPY